MKRILLSIIILLAAFSLSAKAQRPTPIAMYNVDVAAKLTCVDGIYPTCYVFIQNHGPNDALDVYLILDIPKGIGILGYDIRGIADNSRQIWHLPVGRLATEESRVIKIELDRNGYYWPILIIVLLYDSDYAAVETNSFDNVDSLTLDFHRLYFPLNYLR